MSDRLALSNAFEDAGIERNKAERIASTILNAIHDNVATKVDILMVRADIEKLSDAAKAESAAIRSELGKLEVNLRGEIAALRGEMITEFAAVQGEMRSEFVAVRGEMRSEFAAVRGEMRGEFAAVRSDMALLEHRMMIRLGGMMVVAVGVLLAAIRYLHP